MAGGSLDGRRVLVVGASSGIGAALAAAVVRVGGDVAVSARRADRLEELVDLIGAGHPVAGDATDPDDAARVAREAYAAMGGLDLLVYVAGFGVLQPLRETDPETWIDVYRTNVIGANLTAAAALDHMDRNGICAFVSSRTVEDANAYFIEHEWSRVARPGAVSRSRSGHSPSFRPSVSVPGQTIGIP